jgi:hypothetical protein
MSAIGRDKSAQRASLAASIISLEATIAGLISTVECGEKLMDHYGNPVIAKFIQSWSASEMNRLANLRMTLPIDDRDKHLTIDAQYKAAEKFGRDPDDIQDAVNENKTTLERARDRLMSTQAKLNKLME